MGLPRWKLSPGRPKETPRRWQWRWLRPRQVSGRNMVPMAAMADYRQLTPCEACIHGRRGWKYPSIMWGRWLPASMRSRKMWISLLNSRHPWNFQRMLHILPFWKVHLKRFAKPWVLCPCWGRVHWSSRGVSWWKPIRSCWSSATWIWHSKPWGVCWWPWDPWAPRRSKNWGPPPLRMIAWPWCWKRPRCCAPWACGASMIHLGPQCLEASKNVGKLGFRWRWLREISKQQLRPLERRLEFWMKAVGDQQAPSFVRNFMRAAAGKARNLSGGFRGEPLRYCDRHRNLGVKKSAKANFQSSNRLDFYITRLWYRDAEWTIIHTEFPEIFLHPRKLRKVARNLNLRSIQGKHRGEAVGSPFTTSVDLPISTSPNFGPRRTAQCVRVVFENG